MQQNRLLRAAFRVLSAAESGKKANLEDFRTLCKGAPELELKPEFVARYIIEREMRRRSETKPKARVRANAAG